MKRRRFWLLIAAGAVVGVALAIGLRASRPVAVPVTDLETALLPKNEHGWELAIPPKRGGPYRLLPGGPVLGLSPQAGLTCRIRDRTGVVMDEVGLWGNEDYGQSVVYLETPDGERTMAVLRRPR